MEDVYAKQEQTSPAHFRMSLNDPEPDSPRIAKRAGAGVGLRAGRELAFELGMGRPKGSRNKRTLLKEAEQHVGSKYVDQVLDSLYVIEMATRHFFIRAEMGKNAGRKKEEVDEDYKQAAALTALVAPYRHARLSAVKLAGDRNNPVHFRDDATTDELRAELMKRLEILTCAGLIDLQALPAPIPYCELCQSVPREQMRCVKQCRRRLVPKPTYEPS